MKIFLTALSLVAGVCIMGYVISVLFVGESFPPRIPKTTTVTVPFSPR